MGMKSLWCVVLPMLRCWRIMVPLKMIVGFDDAFNLMEILVRRPEHIGLNQVLAGAMSDSGAVGQFVFKPPRCNRVGRT
jgi:hypothetical protein